MASAGAMVPGDRRPAGWLNVWSPDAAPGGTVTDQAADANARAQQFAAFAVRDFPAMPRAPAGVCRSNAVGCFTLLGEKLFSAGCCSLTGVFVAQERMEEGLCRLAAAAITKRALDNVKKRCGGGACGGSEVGGAATENPPPRAKGGPAPWGKRSQRRVPDALHTVPLSLSEEPAESVPVKAAKPGASAKPRSSVAKPTAKAVGASDRALAYALALLAFLLLLLLLRYLLGPGHDLLDDGCRALATGSTRLLGAFLSGLRTLVPHGAMRSAYDGAARAPATCGAKCGEGEHTCSVPTNAALDAELRAARASSAAAAQVHAELEAARSAAASAAKVKAELEAARAAAAAAASLQSQLDTVQAELKAARAQAAQSAKVQSELDAARAAAAEAAQVQAELQAAAAAARVQADLDAARSELDAARKTAAQAARMKAELQLTSNAQATSAQVQAELQAARAVTDAAQRLQAELDAVRAAQAAAANAEAALDAASQTQNQEARLRAELSAAKMATCASKKVQSQLDEVQAVSAQALAAQQELLAAKQELEEARRAAAQAQAVRVGLERARSGAKQEMKLRGPAVVVEEPAVNGTAGKPSWTAVPSPSTRRASDVDWWLRLDTLGAVAIAALFGVTAVQRRSSSSGAAPEAPARAAAPRKAGVAAATAASAPRAEGSHCAGWASLLLLADGALSSSQRKAAVAARDAAAQRRSGAPASAQVAASIARAAAKSRATRVLCALAGRGSDQATVIASLDTLRRLSQEDAGSCRVLACGGIAAALGALLAFPTSGDVAWHACTLLGNVALCPVLQARMVTHPEVLSGRALVLVIKALMLHGSDPRLGAATTGAMWTLLLAGGPNGCVLASRANAPRLLLSALRNHGGNGVVVYNAAGALLTLAQASVEVRSQLGTDERTQLRDALKAHGGLDQLYGPEVAAAARSWLG